MYRFIYLIILNQCCKYRLLSWIFGFSFGRVGLFVCVCGYVCASVMINEVFLASWHYSSVSWQFCFKSAGAGERGILAHQQCVMSAHRTTKDKSKSMLFAALQGPRLG